MAPKAKKITRPNVRGEIGRQGEALAADFLFARGFNLVAKNWRCRLGEIDLIVEREGIIHFVEVKARRTTTFGYPEEAVSYAKRRRWFHAIEAWLQLNPKVQRYQADVISILFETAGPKVDWIENIS